MWDEAQMVRSRPCRYCRRWFRADPRVGARQRTCSSPECQARRQRDNVAAWRELHPEYAAARRMLQRELLAAKGAAVDPLQLPAPLDELPWDVAQKQFGVKGTDFLGQLGRVLLKGAKKQTLHQVPESASESGGLQAGPGP